MSGVMGSGKSTWCQKWIAKHKNAVWISRDNIRFSLLGPDDEYFSKEDEVLKEFRKEIYEAIENPEIDSILLDASHLSDKAIKKTLNLLPVECWTYPENFWFVNVRLVTPLKTCLERNAKREGRVRVPDKVINDAYEIFINSKKTKTVREFIDATWEVTV